MLRLVADTRWFDRSCWYVLGPRALRGSSWRFIAGLGRIECGVRRGGV